MKEIQERIVQIAKSQLSVEEVGEENHGPPQWLYAGGRPEPWCAHFVCFVMEKARAWVPGALLSTETTWNAMASSSKMLESITNNKMLVDDPQPGDIVFVGNPPYHVGIVIEAREDDVITVEGNMSNRVKTVVRTRSPELRYGRTWK